MNPDSKRKEYVRRGAIFLKPLSDEEVARVGSKFCARLAAREGVR